MAVLVMAVAVICSGCEHIVDDSAIVIKKADLVYFNYLTMNVVSDDGFLLFNYASQENPLDATRTIIPDYDASDFKYYLIYKDMYGGTSWQLEKDIEFVPTSSTTGTITKTFSPSYYAFYLYALSPERAQLWESANISTINESSLIAYASLKAHTYIDLNNSLSLTFHLKVNDYSNGKGGFAVSINHVDDWTVDTSYRITAGLYDLATNELVYPAQAEVIKPYGVHGGGTVSNYVFKTPTANSVATGIYSLAIIYEHSSNGIVVSECTYSERINILMNQVSTGEMNIPYFLDEVPEAPSCLIAGYKEPEDSSSGFYSVQFAWCDNSNIEQYFKLQLIEIKGNSLITLPQNDSNWTSLHVSYGTSDTLAGLSVTGNNNAYTEKGTLYKNTTSVELNFPLGKRYIARLCASNHVGDSDWTYLILPQTSTYTNPSDVSQTASLDTEYTWFDADVQAINLYRVSYVLDDGAFDAYDNNGNAIELPSKVFYKSQHYSSGIPILIPDGVTENSYLAEDGTISVQNATLTLKTGLGYWSDWKGITYSTQYVSSGSDFISGVYYYEYDSDSSSYVKLANQPTDGDDCSVYYLRKISVADYTGYENISYIAEYDETLLDFTEYELKPKNISILFMKNGEWVLNVESGTTFSDNDNDGYYTLADGASESILTVSLSNVDVIYFGINDNETYEYSSVTLTARKLNGTNSQFLDNQVYNVQKQWSIPLTSMDLGYYLLNFDASVPALGKSMSYAVILNLVK